MRKTAVSTPIRDRLLSYAESGSARLHMPGHKGRGGVESLDVTEIRGIDSLYPSRGIALESEQNAAALFGSARTLYSAEGSSLCVRAMLYLALLHAREQGREAVVLAGRNAHSSFLSAAALLDLRIRWLRSDSLLSCRPSAAETEAALEALETPPMAVYLTSPDYLGWMADIAGIAAVCRRRGVPLLVDNAHGAYLRFLRDDRHPLSLGADMTCDSAHKTLPVLTGGAYLHIHSRAPALFAEQADRAMALFASTSPSWLILRSLDECNAYLAGEGREAIPALADRAEGIKARLRAAGFETAGEEPLKLTLAPKGVGYTGDQLLDALRERGIECEFADPDFLVMMLSPFNREEDLVRMEAALTELPRREPIRTGPPPMPRTDAALTPREALLSPAETVPLSACPGRILADPRAACPPAVSILAGGERITGEAVRCFAYYGFDALSCVRNPDGG